MKFIVIFVGFSLILHVKCQHDINVEDILYGEEEEEEYEEGAVAVRRTTTTEEPEPEPTTTTTTEATTTTTTTTRRTTVTVGTGTLLFPPRINATAVSQNHTFVTRPSNGSIFGTVIEGTAGVGASTPRSYFVAGQVGNIFNNVGKLNVTGIVDQALGIRNNYIARPLVTGILNVVFCNPFTFSDNNCRKRAKDARVTDIKNSTTSNNDTHIN